MTARTSTRTISQISTFHRQSAFRLTALPSLIPCVRDTSQYSSQNCKEEETYRCLALAFPQHVGPVLLLAPAKDAAPLAEPTHDEVLDELARKLDSLRLPASSVPAPKLDERPAGRDLFPDERAVDPRSGGQRELVGEDGAEEEARELAVEPDAEMRLGRATGDGGEERVGRCRGRRGWPRRGVAGEDGEEERGERHLGIVEIWMTDSVEELRLDAEEEAVRGRAGM